MCTYIEHTCATQYVSVDHIVSQSCSHSSVVQCELTQKCQEWFLTQCVVGHSKTWEVESVREEPSQSTTLLKMWSYVLVCLHAWVQEVTQKQTHILTVVKRVFYCAWFLFSVFYHKRYNRVFFSTRFMFSFYVSLSQVSARTESSLRKRNQAVPRTFSKRRSRFSSLWGLDTTSKRKTVGHPSINQVFTVTLS